MPKKTIKGEDGKIYTVKENKPWYKKVWLWITVAVVAVAGIALAINMNSGISSNSASDDQTDQSSDYDTDTDEESDSTSAEDTNYSDSSEDTDDSSDSITVGDDDIDVSEHETYSPELSDKSWANTEIYVSKIDVYKTDGVYNDSDDKEFNGVVAVDMSVTAGQDISAYPTQGTLNTSDGQQIEADTFDSDSFDGDINSGATANGIVYFLIPNMSSASDLTSLRLKFDASYDSDDYEDDNQFKTYDLTIPLES